MCGYFASTREAGSSNPPRSPPGRWGEPSRPARSQWSLNEVEPPRSTKANVHYHPDRTSALEASEEMGPRGTVGGDKPMSTSRPTDPVTEMQSGGTSKGHYLRPPVRRSCLERASPTTFRMPQTEVRDIRNERWQVRRGQGSREQPATNPDDSQRSLPLWDPTIKYRQVRWRQRFAALSSRTPLPEALDSR